MINKDVEKVRKSLKIAEAKLKELKLAFEASLYSLSILFSYMAMFHSARKMRHESLYGLTGSINKEDATHFIRISKEFVKSISKLIKND